MLSRFVGESEEDKEYHSTHDNRPSCDFQRHLRISTILPHKGGEHVGAVEVEMSVCPAKPGMNTVFHNGEPEPKTCERHSEKNLCASKSHESEVTVAAEVGVGGEELVELSPALVEVSDSEEAVNGRHKTDDNWPNSDEYEGDGCDVG